MRTLIISGLFFLTLCTSLSTIAKEPSLSGLNNVEQITLHIWYKKGVFEGYIIFHDAEGNPRRIVPPFECRKRSQNVKPYLFARQYGFIKPLDITVPKFKSYVLGKKLIYAYMIEPFVVTGLESGSKVFFEFEWCDLKTTETVFILE